MSKRLWNPLRKKVERPHPETVAAVQAREVAEASRKRLQCAIDSRRKEIEKMVGGVLPEMRVKQ